MKKGGAPKPSLKATELPPGSVSLDRLVQHCDSLLSTSQIADWDGAVNGLQMANRGVVSKIAAAVDASFATIKKASMEGADLLVVHHGLFWSPSHPWTGKRYALLRLLLETNMAVYSSHLPLDVHPKIGNNAILSKALGLRNGKPFFTEKGRPIGLRFDTSIKRSILAEKLAAVTGVQPHLIAAGPEICRKIGVVTGGAGANVRTAASEGVDTFITGEGPHWTFALAEELEINLIYGGHYATETFGVRALAQHLSTRFKVPWIFIDHPTGL